MNMYLGIGGYLDHIQHVFLFKWTTSMYQFESIIASV